MIESTERHSELPMPRGPQKPRGKEEKAIRPPSNLHLQATMRTCQAKNFQTTAATQEEMWIQQTSNPQASFRSQRLSTRPDQVGQLRTFGH